MCKFTKLCPLTETFAKASENLKKAANDRKVRNDRKAVDTSIPIGGKVYVKNRTVRGRNMIWDIWMSDV